MHPVKASLPTQAIQFESGSFRDRNGRVYYHGDQVYRTISSEALEDWKLLSNALFFSRAMNEVKIIPTELAPDQNKSASIENCAAVLKHEPISFVSYPYEWCFSMLKDAALLQLELLSAALKEGFILKDSSPYNIQWKGTNPVFIDVLSFTKLDAGQTWTGYRQFCELFLYPLLLQSYKDIPFHSLLRGNLDGIPPDVCNKMFGLRDRFRPGVFKHVYLHSKLQNSYGSTNQNIQHQLKNAGFAKELIEANIKGLEKIVENLTWKRNKSEWSHYSAGEVSYNDADRTEKQTFVRTCVLSHQWGLAWDFGCNTGDYSRIAAENSEHVVAFDADQLAIETLYKQLKSEKDQKILPLVMNLTDASPNLGWRGNERKDLLRRGSPDLILCLALIHHIVIHANVPLDEFIEWLAALKASLIIEFIGKEDPMVKRLLQNKSDQYYDYDQRRFESGLLRYFHITDSKVLGSGTRTLYFGMPKSGK